MADEYAQARTSPTAENVDKLTGPAVSGVTYESGGWMHVDLSQVVINGYAVAQLNPYAEDRIIDHLFLRITTAGVACSTLDVDVTSGAAVTGDDILDGADADATTNILSHLNDTDGGTNAEHRPMLWAKSGGGKDYVTAKALLAGVSTIVGKMWIHTVPA